MALWSLIGTMKIWVLLAIPVPAEEIAAPVTTDYGCFRGSEPPCKTRFGCTNGFALHCSMFDYFEGCEGWWKKGIVGGEAWECCQCRGPAPVSTATPTSQPVECWATPEKCPLSNAGSCCLRTAQCPEGYELAGALEICGQRTCGELNDYTWTEINNNSRNCWFGRESVTCQTCVYVADRTTTSRTRTTTSTATVTITVPSTAVWEPVGPVGESACRGRDVNDNSAGHYTVHERWSLESCKELCLQLYPRCKGVEYSPGRCEIWTRPQGIYISKPLGGFTCLRFGWPTEALIPLGVGTACRARSPTDNFQARGGLQSPVLRRSHVFRHRIQPGAL